MKVKRLDSIRLDKKDKTYFTDEGYLVDHPILTSCGIFEYINPDGSIRRELRLPEYVFDEKSLETYKGKPIIITHDAGTVSKNNVDKEQIGTILSNAYQDGEDVRAEIIIHNTDAMKECGLKELSLGYSLDLIEEAGEWKGQHYDAIQTNIVINHLALVSNARAGEQARLNIDSKDDELKGEKVMTPKEKQNDDGTMTPEELQQAIAEYKAKKAKEETVTDLEKDAATETFKPITATEEVGHSPEDIVKMVRERRENRNTENQPLNSIVSQQNEDIDMLFACIEKLLTELKNNTDEENDNKNNSDDGSKLNADSADDIVRQRLSICRIGDKLNMDGLENKSIIEGKKAIIAKVLPTMHLDGKSMAYIDVAYDMAVGEINKRKDCNYQRMQMMSQSSNRADTKENISMAEQARQKMIEREGGNQ